jgi:hypothetical protein
MKVRCTKLIDPRGNSLEKSPWLTVGKIYHVLSICVSADGRRLLRLVGDGNNGIALFRLEQFEIVTSKIPDTWIVKYMKGEIDFTPESWSQTDFWDRFYDGNSDAFRIFDEERKKIIEADP